MERYGTIEELLALIEDPQGSICWKIFSDNRVLFQVVQGSTNNHQAWPGGYEDHIQEVLNIGKVLYERLNDLRPLPFTLSDLLLVLFLHDIEKPWKYELRGDGQLHHKPSMETKADHQRFRMEKLREYGLALTAEQENGIKYAEGELGDYTNRRRVMGPLAAAAHMCDVASARIWFDHPLPEIDPWVGASRIQD